MDAKVPAFVNPLTVSCYPKSNCMESLSIILGIIGVSVLIFSIWNHFLIRRHLKKFNGSFRHSSSLTDEKYFELKSKQEYIIAASAIVFAVLSFIGFSTFKDLKSELYSKIEDQIKRLSVLDSSARNTSKTFIDLNVQGRTLQDSFRSALNLVDVLKNRVASISNKDIIKQNIFIIDPFNVERFPLSKGKNDNGYRIVKFNQLTTASGVKLPDFRTAPSVFCFSNISSSVAIKEITAEGFKVNPNAFQFLALESSISDNDLGSSTLSLWISQKE